MHLEFTEKVLALCFVERPVFVMVELLPDLVDVFLDELVVVTQVL